MSRFTVVYDACVLYPAPLRDLLMHLAMSDLIYAKWTDAIHEEWIRNVLRNRPDLTLEQLTRTRTLMNDHVLDCLVSGYEELIPSLNLPDPDDRHVLAAAIQSGAEVIVTYNLADFPADALSRYSVEAWHPDEFITHLINLDANVVLTAVQRQRQNLKKPSKSVEELLEILEQQGLPQTVEILRQFPDQI